ncbi:hypothetical protein GCM10023149_07030 [Mucilaginibacter gynuensis]|uniref:Uncharacterized protein n=1 Tax=Mucilaginibacter gynuensis TaxID=1302236 RepID=A0ABP8FVK7_9SPHI
MFNYDVERLKAALTEIIIQNISPDARGWLQTQAGTPASAAAFNGAFAALPRKTGKALVNISTETAAELSAIRKNFSIEGWSVDRLARVWLLLQPDATDKSAYQRSIETLFLAAEMNELVALYSALPLLAYPEIWVHRCTEGNRSNIGIVLEAQMYHNPYPAENLPQPAWNQLVLKAFFTEKRLDLITGLDERANIELAHTLSDYARERWAAGRKTDPMLWRLVGRFIDDKIFDDINIGIANNDSLEKEAIALAITESDYQPAKDLLNQNDVLQAAAGKKTNWESFINQ